MGEKLDNPYTIANMQKAKSKLLANNKDFENINITHNYNYVRIEAKTEEAQWQIEAADDIDLYNYPLDYNIKKQGSKYTEKDKKTPFQVYWAAVSIDYKFPEGLSVSVLEKLYLPFGNGKNEIIDSENVKIQKEILEETAIKLVSKNIKTNKNVKITSNIDPEGNVTVWDQTLSRFIPIEGVTVRAKRWFTTRYAITNQTGFYKIYYNFNGSVDYSIIWETDNFDIRSGNYGQATTGQNNINGSWSPQIMPSVAIVPYTGILSNNSFGYAHAFRAAYVYYYKNNIWNIKKPPLPAALANSKMKIGVENSTATSHYFSFNQAFYSSQALIYFESIPEELNGRYIFGTTIHELAHASHFEMGFTYSDYISSNTKKRFAEAWALTVEYVLTNDIYNNLTPVPFIYNYNYASSQGYKLSQIPAQGTYFPLFIDLIDTENQLISYNNDPAYPNDQVAGFPISILESNLALNVDDWDGMRDRCVSHQHYLVTGGTQANIHYIFNNYK